MQELTNVLTAIAHPSRRAIIAQLCASGPTRFTDVAIPLQVNFNAVTKHLKILDRAGLITREKNGKEVFIILHPKPLKLAMTWVHEYEKFWNERLDKFENNFKKKKTKK